MASQGGFRLLFGLRGRFLIALAALTLFAVGGAFAAHLLLTRLEQRLATVHADRIVPVRELKAVSDRYAIEIVDAVHKVCAQRMAASEGANRVGASRRASRTSWDLVTTNPRVPDVHAVRDTAVLLTQADQAAARAEALMLHGDLANLDRFRRTEMYPAIDPLTARLAELVNAQVVATDVLVQLTSGQLSSLRQKAAIVLALVTLFTVALAAWLSKRLVFGLGSIGGVVRNVAAGRLDQRVDLSGDDELNRMADDINQMIRALATSRQEREEHSRALQEAAQRANAANTAKSLFLSSMSHELRTPLNVVLGYAQLMAREPGRSASDRQALARVLDASRHLLTLIEDVLSISKIEAGQLVVREQPLAPRELVAGLKHLFAARATPKGLDLSMRVDDSVPSWVIGDEGKLKQVLLNLVGNAIKFTEQGHVKVELWYEGDSLKGVVEDTGPGIPAEEQASLFQSFFQGQAGKRSVEGTGLGLYISRSLVQHMGGELGVRSESESESERRGTTFQFHVRAPRSETTGTRPLAMRRPRLPPGTQFEPMLVVDDRATNRELLGRLLLEMGFDVEEATNGEHAVAACERGKQSLVWMDLRMPGIDGQRALELIRARDTELQRPRRKIVAITASVLDYDLTTAKLDGFDGLVNKPFQLDDITNTVESLLHVRLLDQAPTPPPDTAPPSTLNPSAAELAALPGPLRSRLLTYLMCGDGDGASLVLDEIEPKRLAEDLQSIIDSFEFDALIQALQASGATPSVGAQNSRQKGN